MINSHYVFFISVEFDIIENIIVPVKMPLFYLLKSIKEKFIKLTFPKNRLGLFIDN